MVRIVARRRAKIPWRDQVSLICRRSVPKKVRLGIYRTQIRRPGDHDVVAISGQGLDMAGNKDSRPAFDWLITNLGTVRQCKGKMCQFTVFGIAALPTKKRT